MADFGGTQCNHSYTTGREAPAMLIVVTPSPLHGMSPTKCPTTPNLEPRWPQDLPVRSQDGLKTYQLCQAHLHIRPRTCTVSPRLAFEIYQNRIVILMHAFSILGRTLFMAIQTLHPRQRRAKVMEQSRCLRQGGRGQESNIKHRSLLFTIATYSNRPNFFFMAACNRLISASIFSTSLRKAN